MKQRHKMRRANAFEHDAALSRPQIRADLTGVIVRRGKARSAREDKSASLSPSRLQRRVAFYDYAA